MTTLGPAERFLAWLQIEQGRSAKTIEAYRRDLRDYDDWLAARRRTWEARLDRFDAYVITLKQKESAP